MVRNNKGFTCSQHNEIVRATGPNNKGSSTACGDKCLIGIFHKRENHSKSLTAKIVIKCLNKDFCRSETGLELVTLTPPPDENLI